MMDWLRRFFQGQGDGKVLARRMFWAGLAVRLLYMTLAHTYRMRSYDDHFDFGWEDGRIARALATGYGYADPFNGHTGPSAWAPPVFPLLLAGVFKLFGVYTRASAWVILAIDCVFSAATAPAVYEIGLRCFGRHARGLRDTRVALWSGWLWALYPAAMQYAVKWVWDMTLATFLFAWVLVLALRMRGVGEDAAVGVEEEKRHTAGRWVAFGLLWGAIALTNSSLLIFLPACGLWMIWPELRHPGRTPHGPPPVLARAALAALCCLTLMAPWVVRNEVTLGAFVPMRSNFGAELYESLKPTYGAFPWGAAMPLTVNAPEYKRYKAMGEVAYCKQQGARAMRILMANKARFLHRTLLRIDFFWFGVAHPTDSHALEEALRQLNYGVLSVAGLLGLALALKRRVPGAWLFLWAFTLVPLLYYAITVQARFRHPLEPIICVLGVYLFQSAERPSGSRKRMQA